MLVGNPLQNDYQCFPEADRKGGKEGRGEGGGHHKSIHSIDYIKGSEAMKGPYYPPENTLVYSCNATMVSTTKPNLIWAGGNLLL